MRLSMILLRNIKAAKICCGESFDGALQNPSAGATCAERRQDISHIATLAWDKLVDGPFARLRWVFVTASVSKDCETLSNV